MNMLDEIYEYAIIFKTVYIYGAGRYGKITYEYLKKKGVFIKGFLVSDVSQNLEEYDGVKVYDANQIYLKREEAVIVAISKISFDMKQSILSLFKRNVFFLNEYHVDELNRKEKQKLQLICLEKTFDYELECNQSFIDPCSFWYVERKQKKNLFRIYGIRNEADLYCVNINCTIEKFENAFGKLKLIYDINLAQGVPLEKVFELYVVTSHLDFFNVRELEGHSFRKAIQVGAGLTNVRKECINDFSKDNISIKNREYCECTGLYWIWKNTKGQDYVGIEHYRRKMDVDDSIINKMYANNIDMLLPLPQFQVFRNKEFMFRSLVTPYDWTKVVEFIVDYDSDYELIIDRYENTYFYFSCNIGLMKREIFDQYCDFAFYVANRLEDFYNEKKIFRDCDRYMGYIFEHLFSLFIMKNYSVFHIYCTKLFWIE